MSFYLTTDSQSSKVIRFSLVSLVMGLLWLCACSSLKFASHKAQSLDRGLSFIAPKGYKDNQQEQSIDRNIIPHVHPDIIFKIDSELDKYGYKLLGYTSGGIAAGTVGGAGAYRFYSKILKKVIAAKLKPAKAVTKVASEGTVKSSLPQVLASGGGGAAGGLGGATYAAKEIQDSAERDMHHLLDQEGQLILGFIQDNGFVHLMERPINRVCAVYYYVGLRFDYQELDMQYQEEFKKYAYVQDPQYQEWMKKCPNEVQIISWCDAFTEDIADTHPVVSQACERLINKEI